MNRLRLSDIAGMDDAVDTRHIEQFDDSRDVLEIVVRVADDADAHKRKSRSVPERIRRPLLPCQRLRCFFEDVNAAGAAETDDVRHAEACTLDLPLARFTAQVRTHFE